MYADRNLGKEQKGEGRGEWVSGYDMERGYGLFGRLGWKAWNIQSQNIQHVVARTRKMTK